VLAHDRLELGLGAPVLLEECVQQDPADGVRQGLEHEVVITHAIDIR
jgi:hypothetical protein